MKIILTMLKRFFAILAPMLEQRSVYYHINGVLWDCSVAEGDRNIITFRQVVDGKKRQECLVDLLASFLSHFITVNLRGLLLEDMLRQYYFYFQGEERRQILALAGRSLEKGVKGSRQETFRKVMEEKIAGFLRAEKYLNLDGYVYFRLQDYRQELKRIVDGAVENFLMEKEYREFIRLLKYFLEVQEPKIDIIHLAIDGQGQFQITDQRLRPIEPVEWEEYSLEEIDDERDYEDLLVSMLVTVAPRHILLHRNVLPRYPRAVEALKRIFGSRIAYCNNCSYCRQDCFHLITGDKN